MDNLELKGEHIHSVRVGLLFDALANSMPQAVALLGTGCCCIINIIAIILWTRKSILLSSMPAAPTEAAVGSNVSPSLILFGLCCDKLA